MAGLTASLDGTYATLAAAREQQAADEAALKLEEEALPGLETSAGEASGALESAGRETAQAKEAWRGAASTLQRVRAMDQQLADRERTIAESEADCARDAARIDVDWQVVLRERRAGRGRLRFGAYRRLLNSSTFPRNIALSVESVNDLPNRRGRDRKQRSELTSSISRAVSST